ncbi:hypothetical protein DRO35_01120 [Candidatus Bathyarchaeota archaeon]|nr:MAG: hypothetical protein DRO35_01120 [Candidatus Bathyarchaeota archaeon]
MNEWIGFFLAMACLLLFSQKNIGLAMFLGAFVLGIFTIPNRLPLTIFSCISNPSTILLALIIGLIPLIGGILNETGQIDRLICNLRIGKKPFLMLSPALIGLLPMPGGALLSVPIVDKAGGSISKEKKAGVNIWFRHILFLIYPISADYIISTEAAQIELYQPLSYLMVIFVFSILLGYFFFLRDETGKIRYERDFSLKGLFLPLSVLLIAPLLNILIIKLVSLPFKEIGTLAAVTASFILAIVIGKTDLKMLRKIAIEAKPWSFAFMIMGIIVFLEVFKNSGMLEILEMIPMTPSILYSIGFILGFITGRIITPAGIVFPIYLAKFGVVSPLVFTLIYFGIFLGYVMAPTHPCVTLTISSLKVELKDYIRVLVPPVTIAFLIGLLALNMLGKVSSVS